MNIHILYLYGNTILLKLGKTTYLCLFFFKIPNEVFGIAWRVLSIISSENITELVEKSRAADMLIPL